MQFSTEKTKEFKEVMKAISSITEEVTFTANKDGMHFQGMDPSHVCMMNVIMKAEDFETYECAEEITFGIRFEEFGKIVDRAKSEHLFFGITKQYMTVKIGKTSFKIRLTKGDTMSPIPKIELNTKFQTDPATFLRAMGDVKIMSNYFTVKALKEEGLIEITGKGDGGNAQIRFEGKSDVDGTSGQSDYPIEYTEPILRAMKNRPYIAAEFANEKPLRLMLDTGVGSMNFFVAPRIPQ